MRRPAGSGGFSREAAHTYGSQQGPAGWSDNAQVDVLGS
jgi:hypothetical protein